MPVLFAALALLTIMMSMGHPNSGIVEKRSQIVLIGLAGVAIAGVISTELVPGSDMYKLVHASSALGEHSPFEALEAGDRAPLFTFASWGLGAVFDSAIIYQAFWGVVYVGLVLLALYRVVRPWHGLIIFFLYLNLPIFFDYGEAAVHQGAAIGLLLVSVTSAASGDRTGMIIGAAAAPLFHWAAAPMAVCVLLAKMSRRRMLAVAAIWCGAAGIFLVEAQTSLLSPLISASPKLQSYSGAGVIEQYGGVNQLSFLLASAAGACYGITSLRWLGHDQRYRTLVSYYLLTNAVFLLVGFIAFSDRVAAFSWFVIPLLVGYPLMSTSVSRQWHAPALCCAALSVGIGFGLLESL